MSKIISDEEFLGWCGSRAVKGCDSTRMMEGCEREVAKCEDCRAKAQRDSSDREWIQAGDKLLKEFGRLLVIDKFWRTLKREVKENTNEQ